MKRHLILSGVVGVMGVIAAVPAAADIMSLSIGTATYTITSDTNGGIDAGYTGSAMVVTNLAAGWVANPITDGIGDLGLWVAPNADQFGVPTYVNGTTVYDVTFSLSGLNPGTALLTMNLAADDCASVTLNGHSIFNPGCTAMWFNAQGTFAIPASSGDFVGGTNRLAFTVDNFSGDGASATGGPTGLDVAASVSASAVPEPGTIWLLGTVCLALGLLRLRFAR
jgi:hypothetical protein